MNQTPNTSSARGFIDNFDAGSIRGWIFNEQVHSEANEFYVALQGDIIAKGIANEFRKDLEQAGFGDGKCSFSLSLSLPLSSLVARL
ncbi:hypothetical protein [Vibrio variabilis]|uniref:hypothetical protein n=1 Tax=Vibrio variabilis TaxID=990271 RepID=UPI0013A68D7D|nr:hypothetical protein [Vibrio variabilis]